MSHAVNITGTQLTADDVMAIARSHAAVELGSCVDHVYVAPDHGRCC
jgi:hypothetical protein